MPLVTIEKKKNEAEFRERQSFSSYELGSKRLSLYATILKGGRIGVDGSTLSYILQFANYSFRSVIEGLFKKQNYLGNPNRILFNSSGNPVTLAGSRVALDSEFVSQILEASNEDLLQLAKLAESEYESKRRIEEARAVTLLTKAVVQDAPLTTSRESLEYILQFGNYSAGSIIEGIFQKSNYSQREAFILRNGSGNPVTFSGSKTLLTQEVRQAILNATAGDLAQVKELALLKFESDRKKREAAAASYLISQIVNDRRICVSGETLPYILQFSSLSDTAIIGGLFKKSNYNSSTNGLLNTEGGSAVTVSGSKVLVQNEFVRAVRDASENDLQKIKSIAGYLNDSRNPSLVQEQIRSLFQQNTRSLAMRAGDLEEQAAKEALSFANSLSGRLIVTSAVEKVSDGSGTAASVARAIEQIEVETEEGNVVRRELSALLGTALLLEQSRKLGAVESETQITNSIEALFELVKDERASSRVKGIASELIETFYRADVATTKLVLTTALAFGSNPVDAFSTLEKKRVYPTVKGFSYVEEIKRVRDELVTIYTVTRLGKALEATREFSTVERKRTIEQILVLPNILPSDEDLKVQLLERYKIALAAAQDPRNREKGLKLVQETLDAFEAPRKLRGYERRVLGENRRAATSVFASYFKVIDPLFKALSVFPREKLTNAIVGTDDVTGRPNAGFGRINVRAIEKTFRDRGEELPEFLKVYFTSVERMSKINPYLLALAKEEPTVTDEYLRHYFDTESKKVWDALEDGGSVPMLHVGAGTNGLSFVGDLTRIQPELVERALVVDSGRYPGGPFAEPFGNAFQANSANTRDASLYGNVDDYSPESLGGYFGNVFPSSRVKNLRTDTINGRGGSINQSLAWGIATDFFSTQKYPSNLEIQRTIALMSTLVYKNPCMSTRAVNPRVAPSGSKGKYVVTLERINRKGKIEKKDIYTDILTSSLGPGDRYYGFDVRDTKAGKILEKQAEAASEGRVLRSPAKGGAYITHTLDFLRETNGERSEKVTLPEVILLAGDGDSTAIVLERIAGLFDGRVKNRRVKKVYVVGSKKKLSQRPRYAYIKDLIERTEEGSSEQLVEFVEDRITDVSFATAKDQGKDRLVASANKTGSAPIQDKKGKIIYFDKYIANTGFRNGVNDFLKTLYDDKDVNILDSSNPRTLDITLPTNPGIVVARGLKDRENVIVTGVSADLPFGPAFRETVSPATADALIRLRVVNKVSIGLNAAAAQAAAEALYGGVTITVPPEPWRKVDEQFTLEGRREGESLFDDGEVFMQNVEKVLSRSEEVSSVLDDANKILSAMLAFEFSDFTSLSKANGEVLYTINLDEKSESISIQKKKGSINVSDKFTKLLLDKLSNNERFVRYFVEAVRAVPGRENYGGATLSLNFENGTYRPRPRNGKRSERGYVRI